MRGRRVFAVGLSALAALLLSAAGTGKGSGKGSGKGGGKGKPPVKTQPAPPPSGGGALVKPAGMKEIPTRHYRIWTDSTGDWPATTGPRMDAFREALGKTLALPWPATGGSCVVRIFKNPADFAGYAKKSASRSFAYHWNSAPGMCEVIGFCGPAGAPDPGPLAHECVHQFLRARVAWPSSWLNEGLSEMFESSEISADGTLSPTPQRGWLSRLRPGAPQAKPLSLAALVGLDDAGWDRAGPDGYAAAWGLCYFLWSSTPERRGMLKRSILAMSPAAAKDANVRPAADAIRSGGDLAALEKEWRAFLAEAWKASLPPSPFPVPPPADPAKKDPAGKNAAPPAKKPPPAAEPAEEGEEG